MNIYFKLYNIVNIVKLTISLFNYYLSFSYLIVIVCFSHTSQAPCIERAFLVKLQNTKPTIADRS